MESPLLDFYKDIINRSQKQNKENEMILTEERRKEFEEKVKPVMEWLCKNFHPHVTIIIEPTQAEIMEGSASVVTDEFVQDQAQNNYNIFATNTPEDINMENLIKRLENVGTELNRKFGTESYELRCELYDIREALQRLHKPDVSNQLCDCKNFTIRARMLVCKDCGKEHKSISA